MSPLLVVADLEKSIEYYTQKLGFSIDFRYEDFYAGIIKDGCSIHLKSGSRHIELAARKSVDDDIHITFSISQIEEFFSFVNSKSVTIVQQLRQMPYGKEFYIADPDGYLLSFLEVEES